LSEKADNNITVQVANLESVAINALYAKKQADKIFERCSIHFHYKRKRLADTDGCSHKATIDGIVASGILEDDSAEFVKKVSQSQEKVKDGEETIITIEET